MYDSNAKFSDEEYLQSGIVVNPKGAITTRSSCIMRGGDREGEAWLCSVSYRSYDYPFSIRFSTGFRIVQNGVNK